jgi:hypothetical protein
MVARRSPYNESKVRLLVDRVLALARSPRERRILSSVLRRAREHAFELEVLYRELPGVLAGDHGAMAAFCGALEEGFNGAFGRGLPDEFGGVGHGGSFGGEFGGYIPNPDAPLLGPCDAGHWQGRHRTATRIVSTHDDRGGGSSCAGVKRFGTPGGFEIRKMGSGALNDSVESLTK